MWNCIPADIRAIKSMETFKSKMTQLMLSVPDTPPIQTLFLNGGITEMHMLSGAVEEFDGLPNLEKATQRYQR